MADRCDVVRDDGLVACKVYNRAPATVGHDHVVHLRRAGGFILIDRVSR